MHDTSFKSQVAESSGSCMGFDRHRKLEAIELAHSTRQQNIFVLA
jgi:hypothetical protein